MSTVYLHRCADYEQVESVLGELWRRVGAAEAVAGKKVLLKVNLTKGGPPERALATHPDFAAVLVKLVREAGGQPVIGDACSIYGFTRETIELAGYGALSRRLDVPCVPLDSGRISRVAVDGRRLKQTFLSEHVLDADVIISVPKLKPHDHVELTCAVKNMFGALPGAIKPWLHFKHHQYAHFMDVVLDVFAHLKPAFGFADGILAMEGQGPTNGRPRQVGLVAASADLVALDAVMASAISMPPVALLQAAQRRGLGLADLDQITVQGPSIAEVRVPLELAEQTRAKNGLAGLIKYGVRHYGVYPRLNPERGEELRTLQELCPVEAIDLTGRPRIRRRCVRCMSCVESCTTDAVMLHVPKILHKTFRKKSPGYKLDKLC